MCIVKNVTGRNSVARNYNGDGISFQISEGVRVENCESYGHTGFGVHSGTGGEKPVVANCRLHHNGDVSGSSGVYFRREIFLNSGHRNTFRRDTLIDNGAPKRACGFCTEPHAGDLVIETGLP